jgi:hypothetical protein
VVSERDEKGEGAEGRQDKNTHLAVVNLEEDVMRHRGRRQGGYVDARDLAVGVDLGHANSPLARAGANIEDALWVFEGNGRQCHIEDLEVDLMHNPHTVLLQQVIGKGVVFAVAATMYVDIVKIVGVEAAG